MRFAVAAVAMGLLLLHVEPGYAQEQKLVGHWRFDEGEGEVVRDASGEGNDGTIEELGERVFWVQGRNGSALEFRNDEVREIRGENGYVWIRGIMERYDFSEGMTVTAWFQLLDHKRPHTYELVTNTRRDRGPGFRLRIAWNRIGFRSGDGEASWGATSSADRPVRSGDWYHVAGTYDGSVFRIYVNGTLAAESEPDEKKLTDGLDYITMGAYRRGHAYGFNGIIDEVKVYNYALSPLDIIADYSR